MSALPEKVVESCGGGRYDCVDSEFRELGWVGSDFTGDRASTRAGVMGSDVEVKKVDEDVERGLEVLGGVRLKIALATLG
jgi:hypothetical protein